VVVLLILLVLTLIAIAGMAVSTTEVRIASYQYRSTQALQAADAGVREIIATSIPAAEAALPLPAVPYNTSVLNPQIFGGNLPAGPDNQTTVYRIPPSTLMVIGVLEREDTDPCFRWAVFQGISEGKEPAPGGGNPQTNPSIRTVDVEVYGTNAYPLGDCVGD
jgi:hypothetical protein